MTRWLGDPDVKDDPNDPLTRWPNDPVPCLLSSKPATRRCRILGGQLQQISRSVIVKRQRTELVSSLVINTSCLMPVFLFTLTTFLSNFCSNLLLLFWCYTSYENLKLKTLWFISLIADFVLLLFLQVASFSYRHRRKWYSKSLCLFKTNNLYNVAKSLQRSALQWQTVTYSRLCECKDSFCCRRTKFH